MTRRHCQPMLSVCSPPLLPQAQVRNKNINKGDRKDASTSEGNPSKMAKALAKGCCLIDAITDAVKDDYWLINRGTPWNDAARVRLPSGDS